MKKLLYLLIVVVFFVGCSSNLEQISNYQSAMPYANICELEELTNQGYVNFELARKLGLLEMQSFTEQLPWSANAVLTNTPVIIWNTDNTPLYYEFYVIDKGEIKGFITCNALKQNGEAVAYIGLSKKNYQQDDIQKVTNGIGRVYEDCYPNCAILPSYRSSEINKKLTNDELFYSWLDLLQEEDFLESNTTREEYIAYYEEEKIKEEENTQKYWEYIESIEYDLLQKNDNDIVSNKILKQSAEILSDDIAPAIKTEFHFVEPYASEKKHIRSFTGCVQSVLEFIANCYCKQNNSLSYKEIHDIINNTMGDGDISWSSKKWKTIEEVTCNELTVSSSLFHTFDGIKRNIINNNQPVISTRTKRDNSNTVVDDVGHARVVIGTAETKLGSSVSKYYYMWDNGAEYDSHNENIIQEISNWPNIYKTEKLQNSCKFWEKHGVWVYMGTKIVKSK